MRIGPVEPPAPQQRDLTTTLLAARTQRRPRPVSGDHLWDHEHGDVAESVDAPEGLELAPGSDLTPLPINETVASLSAILLDAPYYDLVKADLQALDGLPLLSEAGPIPFKAKAFLDLADRRAKGEPTDGKDVRKRRNDVFMKPAAVVAVASSARPIHRRDRRPILAIRGIY